MANYFLECVKKSANNFKEKIMKSLKTKTNNNITKECKPKTIGGAFDGKYIEHESSSDKRVTITKYLENIRPYLQDTIEEQKIYLTMKTNIVSTTDPVEYRNMYSISDKSKILSGFDKDEIIEEIFESLVQGYQVCEESMKEE